MTFHFILCIIRVRRETGVIAASCDKYIGRKGELMSKSLNFGRMQQWADVRPSEETRAVCSAVMGAEVQRYMEEVAEYYENGRRKRRPLYLPDILEILKSGSNLCARNLYDKVGVSVTYLFDLPLPGMTLTYRELLEALNRLSVEELMRLKAFVVSMDTNWSQKIHDMVYEDAPETATTASVRFLFYADRFLLPLDNEDDLNELIAGGYLFFDEDPDEAETQKQLIEKNFYRFDRTRCRNERLMESYSYDLDYIRFANLVHVSPRWMLAVPENCSFYGYNAAAETIYDLITLLRGDDKRMLCWIVAALSQKKEGERS